MMCSSKSTKSQIVATLKQVECGRHVKDACRDLETEPQLLQHDSLCGLTPIQFRDQHQPTSNTHC